LYFKILWKYDDWSFRFFYPDNLIFLSGLI
jgi:hypothetical protein